MRDVGVGRTLAAEALGTFIYVFVSAGAFAAARVLAHSAQHLDAACWVWLSLAHGLAYYLAVTIVSRVCSGHINPAITIGFASVGHFPRRRLLPQLCAQCGGGILGGAAVFLLFGMVGATTGLLGAPRLASGVHMLQGWGIEALGGAIFAFVLIATKSNKQVNANASALAAGLALVALTMCIGPSTGAPINPARALGPDVALLCVGLPTNWANYVVSYLLGPTVGAVAACVCFVSLVRPEPGQIY